jgi:hypothetical protein
MANGQPVIQGGSNICTAPTALAATTIAGTNKQTFNAFASPGGVGLYGTALPLGANLFGADIGVAGRAFSTGVFGQAEAGVQDTGGGPIAAGAGVAGVAPNGGAGVHGGSSNGFGVLGQDAGGVGVQGVAVGGTGVAGTSESGAGVAGASAASIGVIGNGRTAQGVFGTSESSAGTVGLSTSGTGVRGRSTRGVGTIGESMESIGVFGSGRAQPGVRGDSNSAQGVLGMSGSGIGVHGWSENGSAGVQGFSAARAGVRGVSTSGYGMVAVSTTGTGLLAAQTGNVASPVAAAIGMAEAGVGVGALRRAGVALYARSNANLAARFDGDVQVHGSFQVVGGTKAAVVRHRDGTHRQLYCLESPESWFEDFGEATLGKDGRATVKLDADFASLVDTGAYQVFLTSYAPVPLYVARRTRTSFEIRALPGAAIPKSAACGWRIVARRKDVKAPRLARAKIDAAPAAPDASVLRGIGKLEAPGKVAMEPLRPVRRATRAVPQPLTARKDLPTEPIRTDG